MARKSPPRIDKAAAAPELGHRPFAALGGLVVPRPRSPVSASADAPTPPAKNPEGPSGRLVLRRETKHRGGKTVVVVTGFENAKDLSAAALIALASEIKRALGCGGTLEDGPSGKILVVQGDQPARVAELLRAKGFRVDGVTR